MRHHQHRAGDIFTDRNRVRATGVRHNYVGFPNAIALQMVYARQHSCTKRAAATGQDPLEPPRSRAHRTACHGSDRGAWRPAVSTTTEPSHALCNRWRKGLARSKGPKFSKRSRFRSTHYVLSPGLNTKRCSGQRPHDQFDIPRPGCASSVRRSSRVEAAGEQISRLIERREATNGGTTSTERNS